jgi:hypothetical protein
MPDRIVPLSTLLTLLKSRGPFGLLGLVFVLMPLLILVPLLLVLSHTLKEPYEQYDFENINRHGSAAVAHITRLAPVLNVTINGEHPQLISYTYSSAGRTMADKFQTMDLDKVSGLKEGDSIDVKALGSESIIPSLEPFSFPFHFFFILPGIFLLIGIPFLLIGLLPALRTYRLYQHGLVQEATVLGISTKTIRMSRSNSQQSYLVSYEYAGLYTPKLLGESLTNDFLLVQEKKFGDKVKIFVSETDETKSCLVPRLEALKNNWQI